MQIRHPGNTSHEGNSLCRTSWPSLSCLLSLFFFYYISLTHPGKKCKEEKNKVPVLSGNLRCWTCVTLNKCLAPHAADGSDSGLPLLHVSSPGHQVDGAGCAQPLHTLVPWNLTNPMGAIGSSRECRTKLFTREIKQTDKDWGI